MNKDQVKGKAKHVAGKIQEKAGRLVGSKKQEAKGLAKQVTGKARETAGDFQEIAKKSRSR